jgi:hypothetical protein
LIVLGLVVGLAVFWRFVDALLASGPLVGLILLIMAPPGQRRRTLGPGLAVVVPVAVLVGFAIYQRAWKTCSLPAPRSCTRSAPTSRTSSPCSLQRLDPTASPEPESYPVEIGHVDAFVRGDAEQP